MIKRHFLYGFILFSSTFVLIACQKELDGLNNGIIAPADLKPKVGTVWTYYYYTFWEYGGLATSKIIRHKAKNEENFGGEDWLNIVDMDADTTVYYLKADTAGLYQYANNGANLFCKDPAGINDTYHSFNQGAA